MSFFKDFKEDLSQAVNELMPEELAKESGSANAGNQQPSGMVDTITEEDALDGTFTPESLETMLDHLSEVSFDTEADVLDEENEEVLEEIPEEADVISDILAEEPESQSDEEPVEPEMTFEMSGQEEVPEEVIPADIIMEETVSSVPEEAIDPVPEETVSSVPEEAVASVPEEKMQKEEKVETKMAKEMTTGLGDGPATDENSVITEGMTINGDITSMGSMEVLGKIIGNIEIKGKLNISGTINGNSKAAEIFADSAKITGEIVSEGSVKVGQSWVIVGNITATSAVIAGAVKGDIDVHGPVILDTSAIVMGDIKSKSVQINNGAVIEGHCSQCYADVSPTSFFSDLK